MRQHDCASNQAPARDGHNIRGKPIGVMHDQIFAGVLWQAGLHEKFKPIRFCLPARPLDERLVDTPVGYLMACAMRRLGRSVLSLVTSYTTRLSFQILYNAPRVTTTYTTSSASAKEILKMTKTSNNGAKGATLSKEEWTAYVARVNRETKEFTKQFVTPISKVITNETGEPWGTGNYIELGGGRSLLTNEHVAAALSKNSLAYQFLDNDTVYRADLFRTFGWPLDVAVSVIDDKVWIDKPHKSAPITEHK